MTGRLGRFIVYTLSRESDSSDSAELSKVCRDLAHNETGDYFVELVAAVPSIDDRGRPALTVVFDVTPDHGETGTLH